MYNQVNSVSKFMGDAGVNYSQDPKILRERLDSISNQSQGAPIDQIAHKKLDMIISYLKIEEQKREPKMDISGDIKKATKGMQSILILALTPQVS